jgi:hypothetical protein
MVGQVCVSCVPGFSQTTAPVDIAATQAVDKAPSLAEQRYELFARQGSALELATQDGKALMLRDRPLQTFSSDGNTFGSVLLWKARDGRPAVIGTLGSLPIQQREFAFIELHWLLNEPLKPVTIGKNYPKLWQPSGEDVLTRLIPDAPAPAETATGRLLQMRNLARGFSASMTESGNRHELRLLPQPLYRYEESTKDNDGAIFAFVWTIGTDPEVLLHLRCEGDPGQARWHWQPIRFTWRAVTLAYNRDKVWEAEEFIGRDERVQYGAYLTTLTEPVE